MIYFDNSATTKPHKDVLEAFNKVSLEYFGNPSSLHGLGAQSEKLLSQAREQVARLLNVQINEIYFTSGGTESNNIAVKGTAFMHKGRGRHLITTAIEHPSVRESMEQLKELGFRVTYVPVNEKGIVNPADIKKAICSDTILVSVMHVNNEIGSVQPILEIGQMLKQYSKIIFHVDFIQGVGKVPLDIHTCNIDLCSLSAHKFHGLKGTGALYVRDGVNISPLMTGGGQELRLRSGTENVAGAVAMAKALRLILEQQELQVNKMLEIRDFLRRELEMIEGVTIHTPISHCAPHIINFSITGFKAEVFVHALEEKNVFVSTTSACSSKKQKASGTLVAIGIPEEEAMSAIRISLSYGNTLQEAVAFIHAVQDAILRLRKVMK